MASTCLTPNPPFFPSIKTPKTYLKPHSHSGTAQLSLHSIQTHSQPNPNLNIDTYATALDHCATTRNHKLGIQIHSQLIQLGLYKDIYLSSKLLFFYSSNGYIDSASQIFNSTPADCLNQFFFNTMIRAYADSLRFHECVDLFLEMWGLGFTGNEFTYPFVIKSCSVLGLVEIGRMIHGLMIVNGYCKDLFSGSALVDFYIKCGCFWDGVKVFDKMSQRNEVSWNSIVLGFVQNGYWEKGLEMLEGMESDGIDVGVSTWNSVMAGCVRFGDGVLAFETLRKMVKGSCLIPDSATFNTLLPVIQTDASLIWLKEIHGFALKQKDKIGLDFIDVDRLRSYIASGYASRGCMDYATRLFGEVSLRNSQLWISMISGFLECKRRSEAFQVFRDMVMQCNGEFKTLSKVPLTLLLPECDSSSLTGLEIHAHAYRVGFQSNTSVNNALIAMYARRREIELSERVFMRTPEKDVVSWNTMISCYISNNDYAQALSFYNQMHSEGIYPDKFTFSAVLSACAELGAHRQGLMIHGSIITCGLLEGGLVLQNALMDMYGKCGCVDEAKKVFTEMTWKDIISWNTIISCYGINALPYEAFSLFDEMQVEGWKPNRVTFIALLTACSHAGLVDEGLHFFQIMTNDYGISPDVEHYACIVDILGRAGQLDKAYNLINNMSVKPDDCVWSALLSGCRIHGNIHLAEVAAKHLMELKPQHSGYHVLLSNVYKDALRQKDASDVRTVMQDMGVKKFPGYSWIEISGEFHNFFTADKTHKQTPAIYFILEGLTKHLIAEGYTPTLPSQFLN